MAYAIGVFGSTSSSDAFIKEKATEIGRQIARHGHTLVTGACPGFPYDAVRGARETGGEIIGYSHAPDLETHIRNGMPAEGFTRIIYVPAPFSDMHGARVCMKYRNVLSTAAVDIAIIIGGRTGTMNEFTNAFDFGKDIGVLVGSGGITGKSIRTLMDEAYKPSGSKVIYDADPKLLVQRLIHAHETK